MDTQINTGSLVFRFTDEFENEIGRLRMNPTDPRFSKKCKIMAEACEMASKEPKTALEWEQFTEHQFCEFLGYDCKQELFGKIAATAVMADDRIFASHVLDVVMAHVAPEIKKRRAKNLAKYLAKYAE